MTHQPCGIISVAVLGLLVIGLVVGCGHAKNAPSEASSAGERFDREPILESVNIETTARTYLYSEQDELMGFGLYSYLLLKEPKDESERDRCQAAIKAYLQLFPEVDDVLDERYDPPPRHRVNVFYLPVNQVPKEKFGDVTDEMSERRELEAKWALKNYDFKRADSFFRRTGLSTSDGPVIVSTLVPITIARPDNVFLQDLSQVPSRVMVAWFREFDKVIQEDRNWREEFVETFAVNVRTALSQAGDIFPDVKQQFTELIRFVKLQFSD